MAIVTPSELRLEASRQQPEVIGDKERVVYLGRLAIRSEYLGINDPLTHLYQYLENGESAMVGIKEDIITDIAERLPKTPFVNYVGFEFTGDDFVSEKDEVSMGSALETNLQIFEQDFADIPDMADESTRVKTESQEVAKLTAWFNDAPIGGYLIFESLPIASQKFAISRIYQKTDYNRLEGCFVSLYNPDVDQFNQLRMTLNTDAPLGQTKAEILENHYQFYDPTLTQPNEFINHYVETYDRLLRTKNDRQYIFGLEENKNAERQNGLLKVRKQPKLTSIYLDTIKTLSTSQGVVTPELIQINDKLGIGYPLSENQVISTEMARDIVSEVISSIVSVIDRADNKLLDDLEHLDTGTGASYGAISDYGRQARTEGETYASNGCPEYSRSNLIKSNSADSEQGAISRAFGIQNTPDNFGKPKVGVCRVLNCPSRGDVSWRPDKTLVGGCDFCVDCHKFLREGKSQGKIKGIYKEKRKRKEAVAEEKRIADRHERKSRERKRGSTCSKETPKRIRR